MVKKMTTSLILAALQFSCYAYDVTYREKQLSSEKTAIYIDIKPKAHELIYEKELLISADNPHVTLSPHHINKKTGITFDPHFKEQRHVFDEPFTIETEATTTEKNSDESTKLHVLLASNIEHAPEDHIFNVSFLNDVAPAATHPLMEPETTSYQTKDTAQETETSWAQWSQTIKEKIIHTQSWPIRLLFVFFLGMLLSLSPCIYPMIPITVGILQKQGSSSILRNFLLSSCYALGMGTTFALMGVLAASSGQVFGYLLASPIFILCIVSLLCYFAFSLFGFYNLYIPRFMQSKGSYSNSGSALSTFLFGMASGSFASPCVSPGLAFILLLVATLANKFLGFILLFAFGLGLSTPLVIIGTFSSSINMIPRAGMWMIEVQRIFGFMLLGMCFYYISTIVAWYIILAMLTGFFFIIGVYYLSKKPANPLWAFAKNIVGIFFIVMTFFFAIQTIQEYYYPELGITIDLPWKTDYEQARTEAQEKNKKLLIDFSTPFCSICTEITKTVLQDKAVSQVLTEEYVLLAVDASDNKIEPYKSLRTKYDIQGVPTILIIDVEEDKELKRWMSELYGMDMNKVIADLKTYAA